MDRRAIIDHIVSFEKGGLPAVNSKQPEVKDVEACIIYSFYRKLKRQNIKLSEIVQLLTNFFGRVKIELEE